jgi:hypothetical protein
MQLWHKFIHPISTHFRSKRAAALLKYYPDIAGWRICDLGGSRHFWQESNLNVNPVNVTILNVSLGETDAYNNAAVQQIPVLLFDGRTIPSTDRSYDLVICNSVLEHVMPSDRENLCNEMRRVAKRVYLQTPAYEFPIEPHFILPFVHWLPRKLARVLVRLGPWAILGRPSEATFAEYFDGTQLLTRQEMVKLFPNATLRTERFAGLPKSYLVFWETG